MQVRPGLSDARRRSSRHRLLLSSHPLGQGVAVVCADGRSSRSPLHSHGGCLAMDDVGKEAAQGNLLPPQQKHRHCYHGVCAPNHKLRPTDARMRPRFAPSMKDLLSRGAEPGNRRDDRPGRHQPAALGNLEQRAGNAETRNSGERRGLPRSVRPEKSQRVGATRFERATSTSRT